MRMQRKRASSSREVLRIHPSATAYPLWVRMRSSDLDVFSQIFIQLEYDCLRVSDGGLIMDLGANVGYSSAYFLTKFPRSPVIAVEPDLYNFRMLQRNLAPYGARVTAIHAGVWSRSTKLSLRDIPYRDGGDWTRQVQEDSEGEIDAIDITSLLKHSHHTSIGLLKMDIEGAEAIVFRDNYSLWLNQVEQIAIELHDDSIFGSGTDTFYNAVRGREFEFSRSGELVICTRRSAISHAGLAREDAKRNIVRAWHRTL
jgi:FkbM family methyltransferase